jgi:ATP-binding cassette subfamily F protein 3
LVSHDRYFISQVATKIVEIRDGELHLYRGDYHYYLDKVAEEADRARRDAQVADQKAKAKAKRQKQKAKATQ